MGPGDRTRGPGHFQGHCPDCRGQVHVQERGPGQGLVYGDLLQSHPGPTGRGQGRVPGHVITGDVLRVQSMYSVSLF